MNKVLIFLFLMISLSLGKVFSQVSLFKNSYSEIYPAIYLPNRITNIPNIESLSEDLNTHKNFINTYFVDSTPKNEVYFKDLPNIKFSKVSEQLYLISIDKSFENYFLTFNSTFHGGWDLFFISDEDIIDCSNSEILSKFKTEICKKNYNLLDEVGYIFKLKEFDSKSHIISNGLTNTWEIKETKKGTYAIFFKVQKFYLASIFVTILIVLIAFFYLIILNLPKFKDFYFSKIRRIPAIKDKR